MTKTIKKLTKRLLETKPHKFTAGFVDAEAISSAFDNEGSTIVLSGCMVNKGPCTGSEGVSKINNAVEDFVGDDKLGPKKVDTSITSINHLLLSPIFKMHKSWLQILQQSCNKQQLHLSHTPAATVLTVFFTAGFAKYLSTTQRRHKQELIKISISTISSSATGRLASRILVLDSELDANSRCHHYIPITTTIATALLRLGLDKQLFVRRTFIIFMLLLILHIFSLG
ncbi:hypothetical protein SERLA73DRAFT_156205 [Serpula lacrymans var. lacrymans S7.3]|uniref:Uncharacterized protein n=1 Tax=Serpula lacrymans var. lacrymans (strain S7.3) TaxID=936435 RepID=F8QDF6_SERL3|nr:hypothetical protein SERLA73DRAFT_156205 [Serpula lacrymans var. lacrymans S7.3]